MLRQQQNEPLGELQLQFPFFVYWFRVIVQTNKPANHQPIAIEKSSVCTITLKYKTKKRVVAIATTPRDWSGLIGLWYEVT